MPQGRELPPKAHLIASSEMTAIEMFNYGDHIFCIQGHPEFTHDILFHFIDRIITRNLVQEAFALDAKDKAALLKPDKDNLKTLCDEQRLTDERDEQRDEQRNWGKIHRMGRGGRKSENQKVRVTSKIRSLGYKSRRREPERKLRTNLSSRWSWWSESSANCSPMVALRSPCTALRFLAAASDVVDVTVEEKRDAVSGLLHSAFVFRGGQRRRGWRRNAGMAQRRE
ncbi:Class I glutamine amidotransferase-like [Vigna unguiculata]|uniref:Class I glutamine amidotransferase-like n=1 Tax=Vigna unguiculata TaxID=3917 RepID=A0A4D6MTG4_VIGUN|nr:Class I glutamine amidotransferase-like [Vigna unguiculata]